MSIYLRLWLIFCNFLVYSDETKTVPKFNTSSISKNMIFSHKDDQKSGEIAKNHACSHEMKSLNIGNTDLRIQNSPKICFEGFILKFLTKTDKLVLARKTVFQNKILKC